MLGLAYVALRHVQSGSIVCCGSTSFDVAAEVTVLHELVPVRC